MIKEYKLKNGITVVEDKQKEAQSFTLMIMFRTGSRNETPDIWGISHFLEHMAFKGTKSYPSPFLLAKELDSLGAIYNAFTTKEHTAYFVKGSRNVFDRALRIFAEMTTDPIIIDEEADRERGTIIEELNMYEDDPRRKIGDFFEESLYSDRQISQEIIGSKKSLAGIHAREILEYRKKYYTGGNTVIAVSGAVPDDIVDQLTEKFAGIPNGAQPYLEPIIESKKPINLFTKTTQQTHLALGFPGVAFTDAQKVAAAMLATILGGNMSSRMFTEVREKRGLAYYVNTYSDTMQDLGSLVTLAGVNNEKVFEAIQVIRDVYLSALQPVPAEELRKAKDFVTGMLTLSYEDSESRSLSAANSVMYGEKAETLEQKIAKIEAVTADDILAVAKQIIDIGKLCLALIGPFDDEAKFAKILENKEKR